MEFTVEDSHLPLPT